MDFDLLQTYCCLCDNPIKVLKFDVKITKTSHSKTNILHLIQETLKTEVNLPTSKICNSCYILLNELDNLKLRTKKIENQLKTYIEKIPKNKIENDSTENCSQCLKDVHVDSFKAHIKQHETQLNNIVLTQNFEKITTIQLTHFLKSEKTNANANEISLINKTKEQQQEEEKAENDANIDKNQKYSVELSQSGPPFICEICGKAYKKQQALKIHLDMHNGINPFTCAHCNKSFTQKGALVRHMPQHTGDMPFQCDLCGKRFIHHTSFKIHKISHTGQKSYKCDVCGLLLMSGSHLKRHTRVHTGEKKYSCSVCGKKFAEKYNLNVHEKSHLREHKSQRNHLGVRTEPQATVAL